MKKVLASLVFVSLASGVCWADTFGTGGNAFNIDFVPISGDTGNLGSWSAGSGYTFSGVSHGNYRMGTYEISNDQFAKFASNNPSWTGADVPANMVSWYEAAQFVNYLNTSTGHQAAYKFTGSTFSVWGTGDAGYSASNPYRNSNAYYFLPTENEWVKAAYWNGTSLQTYATIGGTTPTQAGWNYYNNGYATNPVGPWVATSGSQELNGTHNMMGNVLEWMESPYSNGDYLSGSYRGLRGGSYGGYDYYLASSGRYNYGYPYSEVSYVGFRVASIPEPATLLLLGVGGMMVRKKHS